jgi:hypothetical protein
MKKKPSILPFRRPGRAFKGCLFPSALKIFLILGFAYPIFFTGVMEAHGLVDKPPTNTPHPSNTHKPPPKPTNTLPPEPTDPPVATNTPIALTNTPIPSTTGIHSLTPTGTCCTYGDTPTVSGVPTCTFTYTLIPTSAETEMPTDTALPGGPTSTPRSTRTLPTTKTAYVTATRKASETAIGPGIDFTASPSQDSRIVFGPSATASLTRIPDGGAFSLPGTGAESNPSGIAGGLPFLLFLVAAVLGGGAFFSFRLRSRRAVYGPSLGEGAAAALAINPAAVGAFGFTAWLAGQVPLLTPGEQAVLSKVGNGISSAIRLAGGVSDLKRISELGTQEFLQLSMGSPFLTAAIRGTGFAGG